LNNSRCNPGKKSSMPHGPMPSRLDAPRIAVITEDLRLPLDEGAKKTAYNLIRALENRGANVLVFTQYKNHLERNTFQLPWNKFLFGYSFGHNLRAQSSHVFIYIPSSSGTIGAFVRAAMIKAQSPGIPLALLNLQYRELPAFARHLSLRWCVDIIFTQSQVSMEVFRSFGCKTILLPGGVDHTIFRPVGKQEKHLLRLKYGFQEADQIVLHVGHCNRDRNVITLARLVESGFKVILIASTSTAIDHDLLVELRRSGVTVIADFIENVQHFYQMADCYLFPVLRATSAIDAPLSVLEAMACNLPIVTTRFGALPSMFQPGNGLYYWDTDEEIVGMVKQAVEEQECRTLEKVSHYSWDSVALAILETLEGMGRL